MARFDWYQATIEASPEAIGNALLERLPGAVGFESGRGRNNYKASMMVKTADGDTLATILHGGFNGAPNALASGEAAEAFSHIIREMWPDAHRVTRLDSAQDVTGDFETMRATCRAIGADCGIKGFSYTPDNADEGATYYLGATSSPTRSRLYEKGKQMRAQVVEPQSVPADWVRFEVQWKPVREARLTAALLTPDQVFGVSAWTKRAAVELFSANPDRFISQTRLETTFERRHRSMLAQYGNHLRDLVGREGTPEAFLSRLWADLGFDRQALGPLAMDDHFED